jgi:chromosome partitioning protein
MGMAVQRSLGQMGMGGEPADPMQKLSEILSAIEDSYDFIILDTAPNEGFLALAALTSADGVIIPYETGAFNDNGLDRALQLIGRVQQKSNPRLVIHGILPTKTENTVFSQNEFDGPLKAYKDHVFPFNVPRRTWYHWANRDGTPLVVMQPSDPATKAYFQLAEVLLNDQA